jgi:hypothetical protein
MAFRSAVLEPRPKLNLRPGLSMCGIAVNIAKLPELLRGGRSTGAEKRLPVVLPRRPHNTSRTSQTPRLITRFSGDLRRVHPRLAGCSPLQGEAIKLTCISQNFNDRRARVAQSV